MAYRDAGALPDQVSSTELTCPGDSGKMLCSVLAWE
jgi:hypothetical protein